MVIVRIIGGLGNQMFQYALYKNLTKKCKNVKCDITGFDNYKLHTGFELENITNFDEIYKQKNDRYDLEKWDEYERKHPDTFASMYQFWCQKIS